MKKNIAKKWLDNTADFIARLQKFNYIRVEGNTLITEEGYEVSHIYKMNTHIGDGEYAVQIVIHVRKDGHHVQSWGCDSNEANGMYTTFYMQAEAMAYKFEHDMKKAQRELNEEEFWAL
jgi:hypothetical protein